MSKKQLTAAEVLSLITGEREYPTLSCSSSSEVGEEYVAELYLALLDLELLPMILLVSKSRQCLSR